MCRRTSLLEALGALEELLSTTAEIAAAFAGFASVVVIFRRRGDVRSDEQTKVTFQSMLLGSLFVVFFALLPLVLGRLLNSLQDGFFYSSALLLAYIVGAFIWGLTHSRDSNVSAIPYFIAAITIAGTQITGLLRVLPTENLYLVGVFTLLTISGYAFYSLITFTGDDQGGE